MPPSFIEDEAVMICLPIQAASPADAEKGIQAAQGLCDAVELRVDFCASPVDWLDTVIPSAPLPLIVTDRSPEEGGSSPREASERIELLRRASRAGARYIDCEYRYIPELGDIPSSTQVIGSVHNFEETPEDPGQIIAEIEKSRADIVKAAFYANDITDNFRLFSAIKDCTKPVIGICMGEKGEISRIIGKKFGSILTFGLLDTEKETAPGQLTVNELRELYRYDSINENTSVFGVAGNPIHHSASPDIHNAAFRETGTDAVYVKFLVDDISTFIPCFRESGFSGLSVTIPHKVDVMDCIDDIDPVSRNAGAVNTVYLENGKLKGTNTDIKAAVKGLCSCAGDLAGKKVAVLGAGGAARGICFGLKEEHADILVVNRTLSRAEKLADAVGCAWCGYEDFTGEGFDILINTTSVGMVPDTDASPVQADVIQEGMVVFDIIYNPPVTKLLRMAQEKSCTILNGNDMFIGQGEEQFRIWFDREPTEGIMRRAFEERFNLRADAE